MIFAVKTLAVMLQSAAEPQACEDNTKGTRVLISLWDSLMFGRVLKRSQYF